MSSILANMNVSLIESAPTQNISVAPQRSRIGIYCLVNFLFLVLLLILNAFGSRSGHDPMIFVCLLFALCTYPLIMVKETNGRYCLLVVAGPIMFLFFGFNDVLSYCMELHGRFQSPESSIFTQGEMVILGGLSSLFLGYATAAKILKRKRNLPFKSDWKTGQAVVIGFLCLVIGLYATFLAQISVDYSSKVDMGSGSDAALMVLGRMLEPVGAVLVSYAYLKTKSFRLLLLVLAIAAIKLPIGILLNSKEIGITFAAIFIMTNWIYTGKIPLRWISIFALVVIIYFPLSYAYRTALGSKRLSVSNSLDQTDALVEKAMSEKKKNSTSGIDSFASRNDYKTLVELIVSKAGKSVSFQGGHTFVELPFVFVPRLIYPGKPTVSVGQLFNREFRISLDKNTYISTSFLGEMYWNFGWTGALLGMSCMGFFWGVIGSVANIRERATVAKVLILITAIYMLILRFETGIAQQTILFLRSCLIIFLLHMFLKDRKGVNSHNLTEIG
jgi:hypothetical protein